MSDPIFIDRPEPSSKLNGFLDAALGGEAVVCLLEGEAGSGKTRLLHHFASCAQARRPDLLVAYGTCDSFTGIGDAYLPFREILKVLTGDVSESLAEGNTNRENASRLTRFIRMSAKALAENGPDLVDIFVPGGALVARLGGKAAQNFPWLDRLTPNILRPAVPYAGDLSHDNVFEQYAQVLEAMSAQCPLLLLIDDLHWADQASLGLLFHLSRRLINDPVLIVGAYRKEELSRDSASGISLKRLIGELKRIYGDVTLDLDEMVSREWLDAYVASRRNRLGQDFRDALSHHTECNPLFTVELLQHLEDIGILVGDSEGFLTLGRPVDWNSLPSRVSGIIEERISHLSEFEQQLLKVACVQGERFVAEPIADIVQKELPSIVEALSGPLQHDQYIVMGIGIREIGQNSLSLYKFRHNLFQRYLYRQLDEVERIHLHARIAHGLERLAGDSAESFAITLARHFAEARLWEPAAKHCVQAGNRTARTAAPEEAIAHYEMALALSDEHALGREQGIEVATVAERLAGQYELCARHRDAVRAYENALAHVDGLLDEARLLRKLSLPYQRINAYKKSQAMLDEAEKRLESATEEETRTAWQEWIEIQMQRGWICYWRNEPELLRAVHDQLKPKIESWGSETQALQFELSQIRLGLRDCAYHVDDELVELARLSYARLPEHASDFLRADCTFMLGFVLLWSDEYHEAAKVLDEAHDYCRLCGDIVLKNRCLNYLSIAKRRLGVVDDVDSLVPKCITLSEAISAYDYLGLAWSQRAWVAWRNGKSEEAQEGIGRALQIWREKSPAFPLQWPALWVAVALAEERGDRVRAVEYIAKMNDRSLARQPEPVIAQLTTVLAAASNSAELASEIAEAVNLAERYALL